MATVTSIIPLLRGVSLLRGIIHLALWLLLVVTLLLRWAVVLLGGIISLTTLLASVVVLSSTTALGWWGVRVVAAVIVDRGGIRGRWAGLEKRTLVIILPDSNGCKKSLGVWWEWDTRVHVRACYKTSCTC